MLTRPFAFHISIGLVCQAIDAHISSYQYRFSIYMLKDIHVDKPACFSVCEPAYECAPLRTRKQKSNLTSSSACIA